MKFQTDNVYEVAYLKLKGEQFEEMVFLPSGMFSFTFKNKVKCEEILKEYYTDKNFSYKSFIDNLQEIKNKIREKKYAH